MISGSQLAAVTEHINLQADRGEIARGGWLTVQVDIDGRPSVLHHTIRYYRLCGQRKEKRNSRDSDRAILWVHQASEFVNPFSSEQGCCFAHPERSTVPATSPKHTHKC